mgnify:FL=1|tara:strand:+ start:350 stop:517 length:168 start_codon:yes stop_codon:yes gene_type:complete
MKNHNPSLEELNELFEKIGKLSIVLCDHSDSKTEDTFRLINKLAKEGFIKTKNSN